MALLDQVMPARRGHDPPFLPASWQVEHNMGRLTAEQPSVRPLDQRGRWPGNVIFTDANQESRGKTGTAKIRRSHP